MINITSVASGFISLALLSGCATTATKTGWIKKDAATNTGIFVFSDGSRYEGEYSGNTLHGNGSFIYVYDYYGNFPSTNDAPQLSGGTLNGKFIHNVLSEGPATYTTRVSAQEYYGIEDEEFKYTGGFNKGFKGPGTVTFRGGRVVKGIFDNEPTPYYVVPNERPVFKTSTIIGSYFEGPVSVTWKNGATFEGISYRYYIFDRNKGMSNPKSIRCTPSFFYGRGTLKSPGKKDYVGLITDITKDGLPQKTTEEKLLDYLKDVAECPSILNDARRLLVNAQANYDAEMRQGRENARASLARDLLNMPNKIRSDMAGVEAASRGTTVDLDKEKARRNTELNELRSKIESSNNSSVYLKSSISKNNPSITSSPIEQPDTSQPLKKLESKKLYPFSKSVTYQSAYGSKGKEQALQTVITERKRTESAHVGFATNWSVVSVSSPTCEASEHALERGHWVCKVTVMYKGESTENPATNSSGVKRVQGR
ncbi:MAG: hypothetical protein RR574_10905 [Comamonas sp.]